jgi:hypothetical protein
VKVLVDVGYAIATEAEGKGLRSLIRTRRAIKHVRYIEDEAKSARQA